MKKLLSILITTALMVTFIFPVQGFALGNQDLENAISTAKTLLDIADGYDSFNYSVSKQDTKTTFNLSWRDTKNKLGEVNATIDSNGRIINYYSYKPYDSSDRSRLPAVSKNDALTSANAFINKVNPSVYSKIKYREDNSTINVGDTNFNFYYLRWENGVAFPNNNVSISVDNRTGKVQSFYCNWIDDLSFPGTSGVITAENAQQMFIDKLGLKLVYKLTYNNDDPKPYLAYNFISSNRAIDAITGEITTIDSYDIYNRASAKSMDMAMGAGPAKEATLSPEEKKEVENLSNFMDERRAEETARRVLAIDASCRLESINLYKVWQSKADYMWSMNFVKEGSEDGKQQYFSASLSLDAKTGEILNFYKSSSYDPDAVVKYNKDQSYKLAEDFIKSIQPQKLRETEYTTWDEPIVKPLATSEQPRQFSFTFTRKYNSVFFPGNGFNLSVDTTTGLITNYNFTWFKGNLPSASNAISLSQAHNVLFETIGQELRYVADYSTPTAFKIMPYPGSDSKPVMKLVYAVNQEKPANIDALSGKLLDNSGKPYVERTIANYSDISGNAAESQIKLLAQYGISLPGSEFKPNQGISQREFLYLLAKSLNYYEDFESSDTVDDAIYNYLVNYGIIKEGERSPEELVTRQVAVKFIVRALKYDRVADIKNIYKLPFGDEQNIEPGLYGYMAIAYGLNIIKDNSGYIKPVDIVTRAGAITLIYNLLSIGY